MLLAAVTQTADEGFRIHDILRAVSGALEVPVIVLLVLFCWPRPRSWAG